MTCTRPFDALGFAFEVEGEDAVLCSHVERRCDSSPTPGRAAHRYAFRAGRTDGDRCELWLDDDRIGEAHVAEALVTTLVHHLNRQALVELAKNAFKFDVHGAQALALLAEIEWQAACYRLIAGSLDAVVAGVTDLLAISCPKPGKPTSVR